MTFKSTPDRYGLVAILFHWVAALLIALLLASGFRATGTIDPLTKVAVLRFHVVAGMVVGFLTLGRVAWWLVADRKPAPPAGASALSSRIAAAVHTLFYVVILGMVASGIGMMVLAGAGAVLFGDGAGFLPEFWNYPARIPHGAGARLLLILLVLHVGGALYHHIIRRDRALARIGLFR